MTKGPSTHLSWNELKCKDGTFYPIEWRGNRAIELANVFEMIRIECGQRPIKVLSAYRSPEHNRKIGGALHSQHMQGRALDLAPPDGMSVADFYAKIKEISKIYNIRGIGRYKTFVHVDTRPSSRLVIWFGTGMKDDTRT